MPPRAGRCSGVPTVFASSASVPPTSTPRGPAGHLAGQAAVRQHPDALRLEQRGAQHARPTRDRRRRPTRRRRTRRSPPSGRTGWPGPSRLATAWCSTVTSLKPTSTRGPAARIAAQSSRSTIRAAPGPAAGADHGRASPGRTRRAAGRRRAARRCPRGAAAVPARARRRRPPAPRTPAPRRRAPAAPAPGCRSAPRPRPGRRGSAAGRGPAAAAVSVMRRAARPAGAAPGRSARAGGPTPSRRTAWGRG